MNDTIKVLLADDSAVVRRLLKQVLEQNDQIKIVQQVRNGAEAVAEFSKCAPDVVVLDCEMPVMTGIQASAEIRALNPDVPIIMFSSITTRGAQATLDALANGACDYETKPPMVGHLSDAIKHVRENLVPKIITWGRKQKVSLEIKNNSEQFRDRPTSSDESSPAGHIDIIAIGVSTGGPEALREFLGVFPADFPIPIVIVQHMPAVFTQLMAERLNSDCKLSVAEAKDGSVLQPGKVWVAPGDYHMQLNRRGLEMVVELNQDEKVNYCRPAVDVLFRSVARFYGKTSLGVILTGMGSDGLLGAQTISGKGGQIMAQDEATSAVWGMPGQVVKAGLANVVLPPKKLASRIVEINANANCIKN